MVGMYELIIELLQAKAAVLADVDLGSGPPERLLVRSNLTGTMQLYEFEEGSGLCQVTDLPEPVATANYVPGGRQAVIAVDSGGNERHQLYLLDLGPGHEHGASLPAGPAHLKPLTDQANYVHQFAGISPGGRLLAYVSNKANGVDFDLWVCDLGSGEHKCVFAAGGWCRPASGFSPDGRFVSVSLPGPRPLDDDLLLVEVASGEVTNPLPHPDEAAQVGPPAWVDATTFYASSNAGRDFAAIVQYKLNAGVSLTVPGTGEGGDGQVFSSPDGASLVVTTNHDGASQVRIFDPSDWSAGEAVPFPEPGVLTDYSIPGPVLSDDGQRLFFTLSTPRAPESVWVYERHTGQARRLTNVPCEVAPDRLVTPEHAVIESFDGEQVPLFVFRQPHRDGRVVVQIHGGPESQARPVFDPVVQGLVAAGYTVVVPNVRGSTGYGKRYAALDDTTRRLDSVRDLAAIHAWIAKSGLGADKAALWGGSYGGYMVLAGLAFQPDLWAAGVDVVGVSDLATFLENTSDYRRAHREHEYGSLVHDRDFLEAASPLRHAGDIRAPLFVIHGRNDPRVPVSETEQLVAKLRDHKVRYELLIYEDEGHGLARLSNKLDAYPRAVAFLDEVLAS
jgi:dipeptidyl aminopeptidase/acylaminoacyl peptidase